jgi:hypothetical protein
MVLLLPLFLDIKVVEEEVELLRLLLPLLQVLEEVIWQARWLLL